MRVTYYNTHEITTTQENDDMAEGLGPEKLQVIFVKYFFLDLRFLLSNLYR